MSKRSAEDEIKLPNGLPVRRPLAEISADLFLLYFGAWNSFVQTLHEAGVEVTLESVHNFKNFLVDGMTWKEVKTEKGLYVNIEDPRGRKDIYMSPVMPALEVMAHSSAVLGEMEQHPKPMHKLQSKFVLGCLDTRYDDCEKDDEQLLNIFAGIMNKKFVFTDEHKTHLVRYIKRQEKDPRSTQYRVFKAVMLVLRDQVWEIIYRLNGQGSLKKDFTNKDQNGLPLSPMTKVEARDYWLNSKYCHIRVMSFTCPATNQVGELLTVEFKRWISHGVKVEEAGKHVFIMPPKDLLKPHPLNQWHNIIEIDPKTQQPVVNKDTGTPQFWHANYSPTPCNSVANKDITLQDVPCGLQSGSKFAVAFSFFVNKNESIELKAHSIRIASGRYWVGGGQMDEDPNDNLSKSYDLAKLAQFGVGVKAPPLVTPFTGPSAAPTGPSDGDEYGQPLPDEALLQA